MPPQKMIQRVSALLLCLFVSGCLSPSPEEISQNAEDTVLELYRTENYALLSDRDKQAGTAEQFAELSPFGGVQVRSSEAGKYYELEAFLVDQTGYQIVTSSYDPQSQSTTVTPEWVAPALYYDLLIGRDGILETEESERALARYQSGKLDKATLKLRRFEMDPVVVDDTGVFIDLENKLAVQAVRDRVEPDRQLIHDVGFLSSTTASELEDRVDEIRTAVTNLQKAREEIAELDPGNNEAFEMPLMMGRDHIRAVELLGQAREVVSFSTPEITKYRTGGVGMSTTMTASEPLPIRILGCTMDYFKDGQKIGEESFICGQYLQTDLIQDDGEMLDNEAAALNATRAVIRITDVTPLSDG